MTAPAVRFHTTRWTHVLAARGESPDARQALSDLCGVNYAPVLRFLRASGHEADDARELAHGFFASMLARPSLDGADPARGRFRSYLLGALKHFIINQRMRESRQKRGAGMQPESLDADTTTSQQTPAALQSWPADALFDREWALSIIERSLAELEKENASDAAHKNFIALKPWLSANAAPPLQTDVAAELGLSEGALRVAIHRLRKRFRELVRAAVLQTLPDESELDSEMQHLIAALSH